MNCGYINIYDIHDMNFMSFELLNWHQIFIKLISFFSALLSYIYIYISRFII